MANIAIISQRLLGHAIPAVGVALELTLRKHNVTFFGHSSLRKIVEGLGIEHVSTGWDKFPHHYIQEQCSELYPHFVDRPFDLLLCDSALAAPSFIAERLDIPWVSYQPTVPLSDHLIPGSVALNRRLRQLYRIRLNRARANLQLPELNDNLRTRGDLAGISPNLHMMMVYPEMVWDWGSLPPNTKAVGPCFSEEIWPTDTNEIPSADKPVILICLSSLSNPEFKENVGLYLETAIESFSSDKYRLFVTTNNPHRLEKENFDHVQWFRNFPIHSILMPMSTITITHGGCSTLQRAIKHGVPMLIVPLGADHHILAQQCRKLGVAEVLGKDNINGDSMILLSKKLMRSSVRERCEQLRKKVDGLSGTVTAADLVEDWL